MGHESRCRTSLADARNLHLAAQGLLNKPAVERRWRISGNDLPHVLAANRYHQYCCPSVHIWCFSVVWEIILPSGWMSLWHGE